jgi:uncharacterized damage-inducible protein DinB
MTWSGPARVGDHEGMTDDRTMPASNAGERDMLEGWLEFHRQTLARKCEGLTDKQLRTAAVEPSELTLMGLVRHMAEVERIWFRKVLTDEACGPIWFSDGDPDGEFHLTDADTWDEARATWQSEIATARANAAGAGLDDLARGRTRHGESPSLRWIYTHMIEEYARHNGHADLLRERLDGVTGY